MTDIIFPNDDRAAQKISLELWVSRHGRAYETEEMARLAGATHRMCSSCNLVPVRITSGLLVCTTCYDQRRQEKYDKLPPKEYDGESPVYSDWLEDTFDDLHELEDKLEDHNLEDFSMLRLYPMKKVSASIDDKTVIPWDPDHDIPDALYEAIEVFNNSVKDVVFWYEVDWTHRLVIK